MKAGYLLFINLYAFAARLLSMFGNKKAALWLAGRKDIFEKLEAAFTNNTSPVIWFHCASLGEFEQGKPVLETLKNLYPKYKILVTFFSPSGYEIRKNYKGADFIFYLPIDSKTNAKKFIKITKPALAVFIKYEFWFYYLQQLKAQNISLVLVSGLFRKSQPFFKKYGRFHKHMLTFFTHIFVQNKASVQLLKSININNVSISGDTRFDRVTETINNFEGIDIIKQFCGTEQVLVAGSTWTDDDEELDHFVISHPQMRFIIAPHDVDEDRLKECEELYKNTVRFSKLLNNQTIPKANINTLIIDNVGMLSRLYYYATICYVGGAFGGDGIHNILEPAVFGKPVVFGPEHEKFPEAQELIDAGGGYSVESAIELEKTLKDLISNEALYQSSCLASASYVQQKTGATKVVVNYIQEKRLLTN